MDAWVLPPFTGNTEEYCHDMDIPIKKSSAFESFLPVFEITWFDMDRPSTLQSHIFWLLVLPHGNVNAAAGTLFCKRCSDFCCGGWGEWAQDGACHDVPSYWIIWATDTICLYRHDPYLRISNNLHSNHWNHKTNRSSDHLSPGLDSPGVVKPASCDSLWNCEPNPGQRNDLKAGLHSSSGMAIPGPIQKAGIMACGLWSLDTSATRSFLKLQHGHLITFTPVRKFDAKRKITASRTKCKTRTWDFSK